MNPRLFLVCTAAFTVVALRNRLDVMAFTPVDAIHSVTADCEGMEAVVLTRSLAHYRNPNC